MQSFTSDSREIENEFNERLNRNVRKLGNALRAVVNFSSALFVFALINVALSRISHQHNFFSLSTLRMLQENIHVLIASDSVSLVSYMYRHAVYIVLAFAFVCIREIDLLIDALAGSSVKNTQAKRVGIRASFAQSAVSADNAISYRHKVSFLS